MKRFVCAAAAMLLLLCVLPLPARAAQGAPAVAEVDIGVTPQVYEALISGEDENQYPVFVQTNGGGYTAAEINLRGNSSRMIGKMMKTKRMPLELTFPANGAFPGIKNDDIKLINSFTPYRLVAEYLALDLFAGFGIPTPAHTYAFLRLNGVDLGVYIAVEDLNKTFLSAYYDPDALSALYKATMDDSKQDRFIDSVWFGHLFQKGKRESGTLSLLLAALEKGEGWEEYVNVDEWLRFFACVAVTGGDGSIFTEKNNFALYDNGGKFDLIPWDLSEAFSGRKTANGIDRYYVNDRREEPNPLFALLMRSPENKAAYRNYIKQAAEEFLAPEKLAPRYEAILNALEPYLPRDASMYLNSDTAVSELRSENTGSYLSLRHTLSGLYKNLLAQLEGREAVCFSNEAYLAFFNASPAEQLAAFEKESPLLDPGLPQKIAASYKEWQKSVFPAKTPVAVWWGAGGGAALLCAVIAVNLFRRKKIAE